MSERAKVRRDIFAEQCLDVKKKTGASGWSMSLANTVKLEDCLQEIMEGAVSPVHRRRSSVVEAWEKIVPVELKKECTAERIAKNNLVVRVSQPSYLYQLQLHSSELLERMKKICPGVRLKGIKFTIR